MFTLHIEHTVPDYDAWKRAFDSDPLDRRASHVRSFRVMRPVDDPDFVMIDLDFDSSESAERLRAALQELWKGPAGALARDPRSRLLETVESATL